MKARFVSNLPEKGVLGAFANALRRLAQTKTFEQITVRAIVQEAGFSSRTFYNHFKSKYDLVFWHYAFLDYAYLKESAKVSFPEIVLRGLERLESDRELFKGAFSDWVGPESLCRTLVRHGVTYISNYIRGRHGAGAVTEEVENLVRFYVEGAVSELAIWCSTPNGAPPEEFGGFLIEAMPTKLRDLLDEGKCVNAERCLGREMSRVPPFQTSNKERQNRRTNKGKYAARTTEEQA